MMHPLPDGSAVFWAESNAARDADRDQLPRDERAHLERQYLDALHDRREVDEITRQRDVRLLARRQHLRAVREDREMAPMFAAIDAVPTPAELPRPSRAARRARSRTSHGRRAAHRAGVRRTSSGDDSEGGGDGPAAGAVCPGGIEWKAVA